MPNVAKIYSFSKQTCNYFYLFQNATRDRIIFLLSHFFLNIEHEFKLSCSIFPEEICINLFSDRYFAEAGTKALDRLGP